MKQKHEIESAFDRDDEQYGGLMNLLGNDNLFVSTQQRSSTPIPEWGYSPRTPSYYYGDECSISSWPDWDDEFSDEAIDKAKHQENLAPVLNEIKAYPEKKARAQLQQTLYQQRAELMQDVKGYIQATERLAQEYTRLKARYYQQSSFFSSPFASTEPAEMRMAAIKRIQEFTQAVKLHLLSMEVCESKFSHKDPQLAMRYHIHQLQDALNAIKGAALKEYMAITGEYRALPASRSALHAVLQKIYNFEAMGEQGRSEALKAHDGVQKEMDVLSRIAQEAEAELPRAFIVS